MKLTASPESVLALLNQVGKGLSKRKRENSLITFSAAKNRITVIGNGMSAGLKTPVSGRGQFQMSWKKITNLLSTYPQTTPVQMECIGGWLEIGSFRLTVKTISRNRSPKKRLFRHRSPPDRRRSRRPRRKDKRPPTAIRRRPRIAMIMT